MTLTMTNRTGLDALHYEMADQFGEGFHVFVCKQSFTIGAATDGWATLAATAEPGTLITEDQYLGAIHQSDVTAESDLAPHKPRCDVIINASAHAPRGVPTSQFQVAILVQRPDTPAPLPEPPRGLNPLMSPSPQAMQQWHNDMAKAQRTRIPGARLIDKTLTVSGPRTLQKTGITGTWQLGPAEPFTTLPMRYEHAFGGQCRINASEATATRIPHNQRLTPAQLADHPDSDAPAPQQPVAHSACQHNPLGTGYAEDWFLQAHDIKHLPAPRIGHPHNPFSAALFTAIAKGRADTTAIAAAVAGFGCTGRAWLPRRDLIGRIGIQTHYADDDYPALPPEFDFGYWNAAPPDQQCPHPQGGEQITLTNLCPHDAANAGRDAQHNTVLRFLLPASQLHLALGDTQGRIAAKPLHIDTIVIDPEQNRIDLTWRAVVGIAADLADAQLRIADTDAGRDQLHAMLAIGQAASAAHPKEAAHGA